MVAKLKAQRVFYLSVPLPFSSTYMSNWRGKARVELMEAAVLPQKEVGYIAGWGHRRGQFGPLSSASCEGELASTPETKRQARRSLKFFCRNRIVGSAIRQRTRLTRQRSI